MSREILVIKLGALGDLFHSMDAFQAIRAHHRGERVTLLTRASYTKFARQMPWFDAVIEDVGARGLRVAKWWATRRQLRSGGFARVYDLQCNDRTAMYFRLLGPGKRPEWVGMARGCSHYWPRFRSDEAPMPKRQLAMLAAAGVPSAGEVELGWLDAPLDGLPVPEKFVLIAPGCAPHRLYKRWPAAHYAELARRLAAEHGLATVAVGTPVDAETIDAIVADNPAVVNLSGRTSILQVAALARRARGVVGNDTGPIHIAAATGAPTLVVMSGHTDPVRMIPRGTDVGYVRTERIENVRVDQLWFALRLRTEAAKA
jgi:ADP-heptose:LPS heptosyltransferase